MILKGKKNPFLKGKRPKKHIKSFFFESKDPLENLTDLERQAAISEFAKKHEQNFQASLTRLREICLSYNFFQLLAHFGYYDQILLDSAKENPAYIPVGQSGVEILQALILQIPEAALSLSLNVEPPPEILLEVNRLLRGLTSSFSLKRSGNSNSDEKWDSMLSEFSRMYTVDVRNDGFPSQIRRTMIGLMQPLDSEFKKRRGLKLSSLAEMLWNLADLIGARINNSDFQQRRAVLGRKKVEEIVSGFLRVHSSSVKNPEVFREQIKASKMNVRQVRGYLTNLWDIKNFKLFLLKTDDVLAAYPGAMEPSLIQWVISIWMLSLGKLNTENEEHFFLDNPIWKKPIIEVGPNLFMWPIPAMVQSFGQRMLEAVIQEESDLWEKYQSKIRPQFLEVSVEKTFVQAIPKATIIRNAHWTDPISKKNFENDLLILHDTHVLIVECKAGRISGRSKRGDIVRLKNEIGKLIVEPTEQGQRFAEFLTNGKGPILLEEANGSKHTLDASRILRVSRINVMLDSFGLLGIQTRALLKAGLIPKGLEPAATFGFHELENCIDVLDDPGMIVHYMHRRAEIEASKEIIGHEASLLALYLATGFDIGDLESSGADRLALPYNHKELEPYFWGKELNRRIGRPKRRFTQWWKDLLSTVVERQFSGWMEGTYGLLSVGYERQQQFERGIKKMLKQVKMDWRDPSNQNTAFFVVGPPNKRLTIMCIGMHEENISERKEIVQSAFNVADSIESITGTLVIIKTVSGKSYPYSALYFLDAEK